MIAFWFCQQRNEINELAKLDPKRTHLLLINSIIVCGFFFYTDSASSENVNYVRSYEKRQACLYCGLLVAKAARHLKAIHLEEEDVKVAVNREKHARAGNKRTLDFEKLRLKGNFYHNMTVINTGEGNLIVLHNPPHGQESKASDYLPCPLCLGFFVKSAYGNTNRNAPSEPEPAVRVLMKTLAVIPRKYTAILNKTAL